MTETTVPPASSASTAVAPSSSPETTSAASTVAEAQSGTTAISSGQAIEWLPGAETEVSTYIASKGFKDPQSLAKSYMNLERMAGQPKPFDVPKADDAASWAKITAALGVPEAADKYDLGELKDKLNGDALKPWLELFHQNKVPAAAAQALLKTVMTNAQQAEVAREQAFDEKAGREIEALKSEWGDNWDKNTDLGRRGFAKAAESVGGLSEGEMKALEQAIGTRKMMALGVWLGRQTVEAGLVHTDGQSVNMTTEQARSRIQDFRTNPEKSAALNDKRHPKHQAALREWQSLTQVAFS